MSRVETPSGLRNQALQKKGEHDSITSTSKRSRPKARRAAYICGHMNKGTASSKRSVNALPRKRTRPKAQDTAYICGHINKGVASSKKMRERSTPQAHHTKCKAHSLHMRPYEQQCGMFQRACAKSSLPKDKNTRRHERRVSRHCPGLEVGAYSTKANAEHPCRVHSQKVRTAAMFTGDCVSLSCEKKNKMWQHTIACAY